MSIRLEGMSQEGPMTRIALLVACAREVRAVSDLERRCRRLKLLKKCIGVKIGCCVVMLIEQALSCTEILYFVFTSSWAAVYSLHPIYHSCRISSREILLLTRRSFSSNGRIIIAFAKSLKQIQMSRPKISGNWSHLSPR